MSSEFRVPGSGKRSSFRVPGSAWVLIVLWLGVSNALAGQGEYHRIGVVEYYGVSHLSRGALDSALRLHPGDSVPLDPRLQAPILRRLASVKGVRAARLEPVCCEGNADVLYVGIEESGAAHLTFRPRPRGAVRVPDTLRALSDSFQAQLFEGLKAGQSGDDLSAGHSLMQYPPARALQEAVLHYLPGHEAELRGVLRTSRDDESRAIAAWALGYAADKGSVIPDLVAAARDPYDEVRNNAVRALAAIATLGALRPDLGLAVPADAIAGLLRSPVWTDRNKASFALMALTDSRPAGLLAALRGEGRAELLEMARWHTGHAMAPYFVLARMVGVSDSAAFAAWQRGDREAVLRHASH